MIIGAIQARTSSSRLPGKVLMPLAGAPMLARQIERLLRAERIDQLVLATTAGPEDDAVAALGDSLRIAVHRGSRDDVLGRVYQAARPFAPRHVVRLTADCPLADWTVIDAIIGLAEETECDYASNTLRPSWPDGLDAEVVTFEALETAWREATSATEREHVTPFITARPERFSLRSFEQHEDLSDLRWTVDEPRDFAFVSRVYDSLWPHNPAFTTRDVLELMRREPDLRLLNSGIARNEGLHR